MKANQQQNAYPSVSLITMTLNAQNYLGQTIDSVLEQDYPNIEYIFIDGCSRDRTMEIINEKCPAAMKKVIQEPGNGTSQAMNKGFEMASGKYVWALNADDMLASEDTLSKLVQYMETALDCDFVFGDMAMIDEKGAVIGKRTFSSKYGLKEMFYDRRHLPFVGCLLRKSSLRRLGGGFDESLYFCNDLDFFFRVCIFGRMCHLPVITGKFRLHSHSSTSSHVKETGRETFDICLKYLAHPVVQKCLMRKTKEIEAKIYLNASGCHFHCGEPGAVRKKIFTAFKISPTSILDLKIWIYFATSLLGKRMMTVASESVIRLIHKRFWYTLNNLKA